MKRIRIILIIVMLLLTFTASYIYNISAVPDISESSGSSAVDSRGLFYMLENTSTRINFMRVNSSNVIDCYYSARRNTADTMLLFGDIFVDEAANRVYSVKNILNNRSNRFISSSIVYFDTASNEAHPETLLELGLESRDPSANQYIQYIYPCGDYLYFTSVGEDMKTVVFYRLEIGKASKDIHADPEILLKYQLSENSIVNTALCGKDFLLVQTADSKIFHIDSHGSSRLLFPSKEYSGRSFPMSLRIDNENRLHFNEIFSSDSIVMDIDSGSILSSLKSDMPDATGELRNLKLSSNVLLFNTVKTMLSALAFLLPVLGLILLFRFVYRRRPTLLMKLVTFVLPIVILALLLFSEVAIHIFDKSITAERTGLVKNVGSFVAQNVDTDLLSQINKPQDMLLPAYDKLLRSISSVSDYSEFLPASTDYSGLYCVLMKVEKGRIYTAVSADMPCFVPLDSLYSQQSMSLYHTALDKKNLVTGTIQDIQGIWTVSIYPIFNSAGDISGMLETGINSKDLESSILSLSRLMLLSGAAVSLAVLLAFFIALKLLLHPLALLKEAVVSVYNGNYGALAKIKANDEVADISRVFNKLSSELSIQFGKLTNLNQAYSKLVPPDTYLLLNKNSILDIKLGDQVSTKMTIMNAFIRNFEKTTSDLSPETTFKFINRIYKIISSNSSNYSGIVQSYNADRLTVLFQNNPENALQSAICIRSELSAKSGSISSKSWQVVDAGFYIHTTSCIYGIVGEENRYSSAVVAENSDVIYSLDNLQHQLMCSILVTQNAYDGLSGPGEYNHRYIGYMLDSDGRTQIGLYEFFDGDEPNVLIGKKQTLEIFKTAILEYLQQNFYKARNLFAQVIRINPKDTVARWFLFKCDVLCRQSDEAVPELALTKYL
jgi:class 3 adenylate cyclase